MKTITNLLIATSFVATTSATYAAEGSEIFRANCATCHSVGKGKLVGPDLKNVEQRFESKWLTKWIRSSQALVNANDPKAVEIFNANNKIPMPDFAQLNDEEIKSLLEYIKTESEIVVEVAKAPSPDSEVKSEANPKNAPSEFIAFFRNNPVSIFFFFLSILLLAVVAVLAKALTSLTKAGFKKEE